MSTGAKVLIAVVALVVIVFVVFIVLGATRGESFAEPKPSELMVSAAELFCDPVEAERIDGDKKCSEKMSAGTACTLNIRPGKTNRILSLQHQDNSEVELTVQPLDELLQEKGVRAPAGEMEKKKLSRSFITSPAARVSLRCVTADPSSKMCRVELK